LGSLFQSFQSDGHLALLLWAVAPRYIKVGTVDKEVCSLHGSWEAK
jgi:hypothetical protein